MGTNVEKIEINEWKIRSKSQKMQDLIKTQQKEISKNNSSLNSQKCLPENNLNFNFNFDVSTTISSNFSTKCDNSEKISEKNSEKKPQDVLSELTNVSNLCNQKI